MLRKLNVQRCRMFQRWSFFIGLGLGMTLVASGCSKKSEVASASHLADPGARALFPEMYGSFARSSFNRHERNEEWVEYRGEYLRGTQTLKITIDDVLSDESPDWVGEMQDSTIKVAGHPARVMGSQANQTLSVAVGQRFRVSFRIANTTARQIKALASDFDYTKLEALAR